MNIENQSLAEIVTAKPMAASIFESHNLDYCCRGKQKLSEAVTDPALLCTIVDQLNTLDANSTNQKANLDAIPLGDLVDYIINVHHQFVREYIPVITGHLEKVAMKHGENYPYIFQVRDIFKTVSEDLMHHMMKEELILFPQIKAMVDKNAGEQNSFPVSMPIMVMEMEHETAGNMMAEIRKITNNYTPAEGACTTHRVCIEELKIFENDLHQHVHLENNILFPKAKKLENNNIKQN